MPCQSCQNPTLCTDRCQVYAEQLRACEESGQMTAQEVSAHVEAGEMNQCDGCMQKAPLRGSLHINEKGNAFMECQRDKYRANSGRNAGEIPCPDCGNGYPGLIDASGFGDLIPCPECKGTGRVEAGEMPDDLSQKQDEFCDAHCTWRDHHPDCVRARSGEAGEMEAAKGDYGD